MDAYKEIAEINSLDAENEFRSRIEDIYGSIPSETENLINIAVVKMLAMKLGVKEINVKKATVNLVFSDFNAFADKNLARAMDEFSDCVTISMATEPSLEFIRNGQTNGEMLSKLRAFLTATL